MGMRLIPQRIRPDIGEGDGECRQAAHRRAVAHEEAGQAARFVV
jgi:hypothetical protein